MNRRDFIKGSGLLLVGGLIVQWLWVAASFLRSLRGTRTAPAGRWIELGRVDAFVPGTVTPFPQWRLHLVRLPDGGWMALSNSCTHLGCVVPWVAKADRFVCPCHASAFDMTGAVMHRPAPRPLDLHRVLVEDSVVKVDLDRTIRRGGHRADHVYYPEGKSG